MSEYFNKRTYLTTNISITPEQLLQLISETFIGTCITDLTTGEYSFSDSFSIDKNIADEALYLSNIDFNYKVKYTFFYNIVNKFSKASNSFNTIRVRDNLINTLFEKLSHIYSDTDSNCKLFVKDNQIISIILGRTLPSNSGFDYERAGIPEESENFELSEGQMYFGIGCWKESYEPKDVIVISKDYFRINSIEYCNGNLNFLVHPEYEPYFFNEENSQNGQSLNAVISAAYRPEEYTLLFSRFDSPRKLTKNSWYSKRSKDIYIFVDETELKEIKGYIKIPINHNDTALQAKLDEAKTSGADILYKEVSVIDKSKLIKHDKYAIVGNIGPIFISCKTNKWLEIAKKTENTRTFRADILDSLLGPIADWILGDELNYKNLNNQPFLFVSTNIGTSILNDISSDIVTAFGVDWRTNKTISQESIVASIRNKITERIFNDEQKFKELVRSYAKTMFSTNSRANFFGLCSDWAYQGYNCQPGHVYTRDCVVQAFHRNNARYSPYSFKDTVLTIDFSNLLMSLYVKRTNRYSNELGIIEQRQLMDYYHDNFIPQPSIEEAINKIKDDHCIGGLSSYYFPRGLILPAECISLTTDAVEILKATGSIRTYSELNTWFTFAKNYLSTVTFPSLIVKTAEHTSDVTVIAHTMSKFTSFLQYMDWALMVLEEQELELL